MSPLGWRSPCLVLLTLLWTTGRGEATQSQPSAVSNTPDPEQVMGLIVQEVTAKVESLISQLASKIEGLDSRLINLDSRLTNVDSRLTSVDSRLSGIESRLNVLDLKQDSFDASLDSYSSRIESAEAKLDSGLVPLTSRVNSTEVILRQLMSLINTTDDRLGSRVEELVSQVNQTSAGQSDRLDRVSSRLDDLSSRLDDLANRTDTLHPLPRDCSGLPPRAQSGIYLLQLDLELLQPPVSAYCDLETDGGRWTVIQRRKDIEPRQNFNLNWTDYREGFGDLHEEFWWGLQNVWKLTGTEERQYELRVNLADFEGERRFATYSRFRVGPEPDGYRLTVSGYSGNAGDSLRIHSGKKFSTKDRDQDGSTSINYAQKYNGGWWFEAGGYTAFLNGVYRYGKQDEIGGCVNWHPFRGVQYSLREAEMKIRPV